MTCLDRDTLDEAYLVAAEIAVFDPQRAAVLLQAFRAARRRTSIYWASTEEPASVAHGRLIDLWEALCGRPVSL